MDRSERFYKIHGMLQHRKVVRTQEFLDQLEVSKATFKRDLEYLRDRMGAPIVYDRHEEAYRYDMGVADRELWQLPGLWFTAEEMLALLTMEKLLAELQPGVLSEAVAPLRQRLKSMLASQRHSAADIAQRIRILAMGSRKVDPAHFRVLSTAVLSRRRLRIRHLSRRTGEVSEREVSPQRLVHYRDNWYLDAWCHKRQALRTFGVDAIESASVSDKAARDLNEETLDRHFTTGYGIFAGSETQDAVLLFSEARAPWVSREVWHPRQDGKMQLDGSYLLRLPYAQEPELVMDILRYGPDVQVLAPDTLREAVAAKLQAATALYSDNQRSAR